VAPRQVDAEGKKHEETPEAHLQYLGALRMATERPAEFAAMSDEALAKYQPLLTPQHYQQLIAMRTGINKDQARRAVGQAAQGSAGAGGVGAA
jgi:hypothetical protein